MLLLNTLAILVRLYNTQTGEEITNPDEMTKKVTKPFVRQ